MMWRVAYLQADLLRPANRLLEVLECPDHERLALEEGGERPVWISASTMYSRKKVSQPIGMRTVLRPMSPILHVRAAPQGSISVNSLAKVILRCPSAS